MEWDLIPFDQLVWGEKLGQGSFGVVCVRPLALPCTLSPELWTLTSSWPLGGAQKGTYLGVEVAIKEVRLQTSLLVQAKGACWLLLGLPLAQDGLSSTSTLPSELPLC